MDRCALFVDAGYVLGDGALAVHGTRNRESVSWDYAAALEVLKNVARDHTGLPLLRCYWYEAPVEAGRSPEHDILADLPGVKLRLGKMKHGRREGVESEIRRDLTTLARNRAISDALVVSAEEDLAQAICDVQDLGLRVTVVHIAAPGWTAAAALRRECDEIVEIGAAHLRGSVELVVGAEPVAEEEQPSAGAYTGRGATNGHGTPGVIGQPTLPAGAHAGPPPIYTGSVIAEYRRAAQPGNSHGSAPADVSGQAVADSQGLPGVPSGAEPVAPASAAMALPPAVAPPPGVVAPPPAAVGPPPGVMAPPPGVIPLPPGVGAPPSPPAPGQGGLSGPLDSTQPTLPSVPQAPVSQPAVAAQPTGSQPDIPGPQAGPLAPPGHHAAVPGHHAASGLHAAMPGHHVAQAPQHALSGPPPMQPGQLGPPPQPSLPPLPSLPPPRGGGEHAGPAGGPPPSRPTTQGQYAQPDLPPQHPSGPLVPGPAMPGQPVPGQLGAPAQGFPPPAGLPGQPGPPSRQGPPAYQTAPPPSAPAPTPVRSSPAPLAPPPGFSGRPPDMAVGQAPAVPRPPTAGAPPGPLPAGQAPVSQMPAGPGPAGPNPSGPGPSGPGLTAGPVGGGPAPSGGQSGQELRGGPSGYPAVPPPGLADQRTGQFPVPPGQPGSAPYVPYQGPHSGPQPAAQQALVPQPAAVSLAEAVRAAHGEGFSFGQEVARDAPALWLEAVLARRPRMPSDLEAKLLQDSSLPIDSLLHDEVRHALRRGFWDALERFRH